MARLLRGRKRVVIVVPALVEHHPPDDPQLGRAQEHEVQEASGHTGHLIFHIYLYVIIEPYFLYVRLNINMIIRTLNKTVLILLSL